MQDHLSELLLFLKDISPLTAIIVVALAALTIAGLALWVALTALKTKNGN